LFHEFQPMGGVGARLADGEVVSCATAPATRNSKAREVVHTACLVFMQTFYQKRLEIGIER
jgi:hypothetical protein